MNKEEIQKQIDNLQKELDKLKEEPNLEVGTWYRNKWGTLMCYNDTKSYGFTCNNEVWNVVYRWCHSEGNEWKKVDRFEVLEVLKKEATRQGFKIGAAFKSMHSGEINTIISINGMSSTNSLVCSVDNLSGCITTSIMTDGKWAEIIKEKPIMIKTTDGELEAKVVSSFEYNQVKIGCKYIDEETLKILLKWNSVNETGKDDIKKILKQMKK